MVSDLAAPNVIFLTMFFGDNVDGYDVYPCTKNWSGVFSIRPLNRGQSSIIDEVQPRRGLEPVTTVAIPPMIGWDLFYGSDDNLRAWNT